MTAWKHSPAGRERGGAPAFAAANRQAAERRLRSSGTLRRLAAVLAPVPVFLTGGTLRDRLLGLPGDDLDLVVLGDARHAALALGDALGARTVEIGRPPFVTRRLVRGGRHVDVWGIDDPKADILRRDFTVNALFWRLPTGPMTDLVRGLEDLEAGRLRIVAESNLAADPLRVLRAVRLVATRPALRTTASTEAALARHAPALAGVARERVSEEVRRMLVGPGVDRALATAWRLGLLASLVPGWSPGGDAPHREFIAARRLADLQRGAARSLARGAAFVAPAVLAARAAGFPGSWTTEAGAAALARVLVSPRAASSVSRAAFLGGELAAAIALARLGTVRELAVDAADLLPAALAWAVATAHQGQPPCLAEAQRLLAWQRRFRRRPSPLDGDEIARLMTIPPGPARAGAIRALARARARGEIRGVTQARRFLLGLRPR